MTIRVAVVGEDPLARAGLVALFAEKRELALKGQGPPSEFGRLSAEADVILWDMGERSPAGAGPGAGGAPVVALVLGERQAVQALTWGASGALPRDVPPGTLLAAIRAASEGLLVVDESFAPALVRRETGAAPPMEPLTPRELEVLSLLGEGLSNKAIAGRLGISESTAKFHVNSILSKLGAESRAEAIVIASRLGLVLL